METNFHQKIENLKEQYDVLLKTVEQIDVLEKNFQQIQNDLSQIEEEIKKKLKRIMEMVANNPTIILQQDHAIKLSEQTVNEIMPEIDMYNKRRKREFVKKRSLFSWLATEFGAGPTAISEHLHCDHSTVLHNLNTFRNDLEIYSCDQALAYEALKQSLEILKHGKSEYYALKATKALNFQQKKWKN